MHFNPERLAYFSRSSEKKMCIEYYGCIGLLATGFFREMEEEQQQGGSA